LGSLELPLEGYLAGDEGKSVGNKLSIMKQKHNETHALTTPNLVSRADRGGKLSRHT